MAGYLCRWLDEVSQKKIPVPQVCLSRDSVYKVHWNTTDINTACGVVQICYTREWTSAGVTLKSGCAHKAPGAIVAAAEGQTDAMAPAGATWSLIDSASDFLPEGIFNAVGLEPWHLRDPWRECDEFTVNGTQGWYTCKDEAIGINIDKDVPTLKAFAKIHKVCTDPGSWKSVSGILQGPCKFNTSYLPERILSCRRRVQSVASTLPTITLREASPLMRNSARSTRTMQ